MGRFNSHRHGGHDHGHHGHDHGHGHGRFDFFGFFDSLLARLFPVRLDDGVFDFVLDSDYTIDFKNNFVQIKVDGGRTTNLSLAKWEANSVDAADLDKLTFKDGVPASLNISGVGFVGADVSGTGGAETGTNIDDFLTEQLALTDAGSLAEALTIDGSQAGTFAVLWEFLDDGYVEEGYFASVNENFVRLGIAYAEYLEDGGAPLTEMIGKFAPDGPDADLTPERLQSLHDNLLGNLGEGPINSRFASDPATGAELISLIEAIDPDLLDRPYYSGNDNAEAAYDAVRAYDFDKGYARTDFIDTFFGAVDDRATNGGAGVEMIFGDGNSTDGYAITRHEGAGVELALKAKLRGVGDLDPSDVTYNADGTATFRVEADPASADRMEWNIDWAATVTEAGDDDSFVFKFLADVDGSAAEDFIDLTATGSEYTSNGDLQNSWNYGFFPDADFDTTDAEGLYTVRLEAYDDGALIATQDIYLEVL
jgi:hypothetical protein